MSRPEPCPICKVSAPDTKCDNTIRPGEPLPGRDYHRARIIEKEPTDVTPTDAELGAGEK